MSTEQKKSVKTVLPRIDIRKVEDWIIAHKQDLEAGKLGNRYDIYAKAKSVLNIGNLTPSHINRSLKDMNVKPKHGGSKRRAGSGRLGGGDAGGPNRLNVVSGLIQSLASELRRTSKEWGDRVTNPNTEKLDAMLEVGCHKFIEIQHQRLRRDSELKAQAEAEVNNK